MKAILAAVCVLGAVAAPAAAQTPLFTDTSEVQFVIDAPMGTIVRNARRNTDPHPGTITVVEGGQSFPIELAARGLSRRTLGICNFPPLRLDIEGESRRGTIFQGQNRLKVVTQCSNDELVARELLAYRLYNELTPLSYRVRPARITYRDSDGGRREETQLNFLIEDVDDLARRNDLVEITVPAGATRADQLDANAAARYALFQFMIGNLDWDMITARPGEDCCHNSRLLGATAETRTGLIPAPYDFDFAGLVGARYATPPPSIPINDVRQRYYRGFCVHNAQIPAAIELFRSRREALNGVIAGSTLMSEASRRTARAYLDDFFELIEDPDRVERLIIRRCRS